MNNLMYEKAVRMWQEKNIRTADDLAFTLDGFHIAFAYNSGKLENENITYNDTRDIFNNERISSYTGDLRTLYEIHNEKKAYELFLSAFDAKRAIDEAFIKELHYTLTQNTYDERRMKRGEHPGEYKHHDYVAGVNETGAAAEDVPSEIAELLTQIQDVKDKDALTAAAYLHAVFENIHPFADGNGRTGRMLMNYFLAAHNHPLITIHEEDRAGYYAALDAWDERRELDPLKIFLKEQTVKTWRRAAAKR